MPCRFKTMNVSHARRWLGRALLLSLSGLTALAGCDQQSEGGDWVRLPGGRMVQTLESPKETEERLIYRIDDARFFSMTVAPEYDESCMQGTVWYWDTKQNIHSSITSGELPGQEFSIDGKGLLVLPQRIGGDLSPRLLMLYYSTDGGRIWAELNTRHYFGDGPYFVRDGIFAKVNNAKVTSIPRNEGGYDDLVEVDKVARPELSYMNLAHVLAVPDSLSAEDDDGISRYIEIDRANSQSILVTFKRAPNSGPYDQDFQRTEGKSPLDGLLLMSTKTPSGWSHFRCEPMPKMPSVAMRKDAL